MTISMWRRFREALFNPSANPFIFFVVAYLTGISINLTSNLLQKELAERKASLVIAAIAFGIPALVVLLLLTPKFFRWWLKRRLTASAKVSNPRPHKGLIAIASAGVGIQTAEKAIKYHWSALERVWLISSADGYRPSEPLAMALKLQMERDLKLNPEVIKVVPLTLAEFDDPESVRNAIEKIYSDELPEHFSEDDVIIDITGGKKTTTAGAFLAGLLPGRHLEVINSRRADDEGNVLAPADPIQIDIAFPAIRGKAK